MKRFLNSISLTRIGDFLFWTACFLYFRFMVYPPLIAERQEPVFLFGRAFLEKTVFHPGGWAEYFSLPLTRCMEFPWAGALILTALAGAVVLAWRFAAVQTAGSREGTGLPALLIAALLVGLHGHYAFRFATDIGLFLAFGSIGIILLLGRGRDWLAVPLTLAVSPVLYWLAGGPFLFLLAWMWIRAILGRGINGPVRLAAILGLPLIGRFLPWIFDPAARILAPEFSLFRWLPFDQRFPIPFMFHIFTALVLLIEIVLLLNLLGERRESSRNSSRFLKFGPFPSAVSRTAVSVIPLILLLAISRFSPASDTRSRLLIASLSHHGEWNALLAEALKNPGYDKPAAFHVNRALERLGVMGEEMFRYSAKWGLDGLIPLKEQALSMAMDYSDFWFDLGDVNEAEHWAHEAWTQKGETPAVLERLAQVNLIKNNRAMAESAVALMGKSPFMKKTADHYRLLLDRPEWMTGDPEIAKAVSLRPKKDFIVRLHLPEAEVVALMRQNPGNRPAFEYFMAYTMLSRELYLFVQKFGRINGFDYSRIPSHWEEALIMFMIGKGQKEPVFAGRAIRPETILRFNDFQRILKSFNNDRISARDALAEKYGGTYWFFLLYTAPNARTDSEAGGDAVTGATEK
jgi:hypothetical protein